MKTAKITAWLAGMAILAVLAAPRAEGGSMPEKEKATFAAGCFWGVEKFFHKAFPSTAITVGYTAGKTKNPSNEDVCTGRTGHAEAVEIEYDPQKVRYEDLLVMFWRMHDPTTPNQQGPDIGTQYRSGIYFHTPAQEAAAGRSKELLEKSGHFGAPITTEIAAAGPFYAAEDYHQDYLANNPFGYCSHHLEPEGEIGKILKQAR